MIAFNGELNGVGLTCRFGLDGQLDGDGPFRVKIWVLSGLVMVPIERRDWFRRVTAEADGNFDLAKNDQPVNSIREFRMIPRLLVLIGMSMVLRSQNCRYNRFFCK